VQLSNGKPVLFGPNLAPFQAPAITVTSPAFRKSDTALVGWDTASPQTAAKCRYAVIYHRRADLADIEWVVQNGKVVDECSLYGVWLTRLIQLDSPSTLPPGRLE
jgi:hypothetical protein